MGRQSAVPAVLGDHQARRHHGHRAGQRPVPVRAAPAAGHRRGRRPLQGSDRSRHRHPHPRPHGRPAPPQGAGHRRRLVPAEGHARPQDPGRRAGQALRRPDARHRTGMRLRHRRRAQLPALRDPFAARPAGGGLPADAQVDPGDVRRRRRRVQPARRLDGGPAGRSGRLLRLLHQADRVTARAPDRRPGIGDRQRPHRRRTAVGHGHRVLLRDHRQRRTRHHQGRDLRRPARAHREPRRAGATARRTWT